MVMRFIKQQSNFISSLYQKVYFSKFSRRNLQESFLDNQDLRNLFPYMKSWFPFVTNTNIKTKLQGHTDTSNLNPPDYLKFWGSLILAI